MSSGPAFVYLETSNAKTGKSEFKLISPEGLTRSKLCELSIYASKVLGWKKGTGKKELMLDAEVFDEIAVKKILKAMVNNNIVKPTPLSVESLKITSFDELVTIHRMSKALDLNFKFRDDDIRNTIVEGIKKKPLSFYRFKQLIEELDFDAGLMKLAKHNVMYGAVKGKEHRSPEFVEIRQYCMLHNAQYQLWDQMEAVRVEIIQKMEATDRKRKKGRAGNKEAGAVLQVADEEDFPALPGMKQ